MKTEDCVVEKPHIFPSIEEAKENLKKWETIDERLTILTRTTRQIGNPLYAGCLVLSNKKIRPSEIEAECFQKDTSKDGSEVREYCRQKFFDLYKTGIVAISGIPFKVIELFGKGIDVKAVVSPVFAHGGEYVVPEVFVMINFDKAVVSEEKIDTLNSFIEKAIKAFE